MKQRQQEPREKKALKRQKGVAQKRKTEKRKIEKSATPKADARKSETKKSEKSSVKRKQKNSTTTQSVRNTQKPLQRKKEQQAKLKKQAARKKQQIKRRVIRWGIILAMSSVVGLLSWTLIHSYIFHPISGTSMTPTVTDGSVVLLKKSEDVKRFDLIGFAIAGESDRFVKRIIGLPEDPIFVSGTRLVIDLEGEGRFVNTYSVDLTDSIAKDWRELTRIPQNCYFVLGDNLQVSKDSRSFGWVNTESVEGRVQWIQNK